MSALEEDTPWQEFAFCFGINPAVFFPEPVTVPGGKRRPDVDASVAQRAGEEYAQSICLRCPVTAACRDYADANRIRDGVWGGEISDDRRARWKAERRARLRLM